ncbi:glucose 1-dehydrogenase [Bryobacterales bacterium F-183]|nr:glucose 1-dehydrogenase [Bryobacterales bacterium F-183]
MVTGAARGIGQGIAQVLLRNGARVVGVDRTAGEGVDVVADISTPEANRDMVAYAVQKYGRLDAVVACAAVSRRGPFVDIQPEDLAFTFAPTLYGAFYTCQAGAKQLIAQGGGGSILIVGSVHVHQHNPNSASYNMAKAAMASLSRTIASELAGYGIRVNSILPGWTDTPGELNFATREQLDEAGRRLPLGRLGQPEDVGQAALYLLSDEAAYVTGCELLVDGGITLNTRSANSKGNA